MEFKDVVKAHPLTPSVAATPEALSSKMGAVVAAVAKLSAASYPFIKNVDWTSDVYEGLAGRLTIRGDESH